MYSVLLMAAMTAGAATPASCWGCHGCYSSCYGCWGCSGCSGCSGCWGCSGCYSRSCWGGCWGSCSGCYGCYGCSGCYGCWGSCYSSCYGSCYACHGCYGCYGCYGCHGAPATVPAAKPEEKKAAVEPAARAKVVVELPADAKLFVDDKLTKAEGTERSFSTPELQAGQEYYYVVRAEVVRDGKPVTATKRLTVRAGELSKASFTELSDAAEVTTASK